MLIQKTTKHNPEDWFSTSFGRWVLAQEQRYCNQMSRDSFGFFTLQLGLSHRHLTRRAPTRNHAIVGLSPHCQIIADWAALPFADDSVDFILLTHALEASANPHAVLREAVRVLRPHGRLVIAGFNPWSLLGMTARLARLPWHGKWLPLHRLKDWLALLDMAIVEGRFAVFLPPLQRPNRRRFGWMEKAGRRWWPLCGGVYFISASKHRLRLHVIMPDFAERRLSARAAAAEVPQKTIYER